MNYGTMTAGGLCWAHFSDKLRELGLDFKFADERRVFLATWARDLALLFRAQYGHEPGGEYRILWGELQCFLTPDRLARARLGDPTLEDEALAWRNGTKL